MARRKSDFESDIDTAANFYSLITALRRAVVTVAAAAADK